MEVRRILIGIAGTTVVATLPWIGGTMTNGSDEALPTVKEDVEVTVDPNSLTTNEPLEGTNVKAEGGIEPNPLEPIGDALDDIIPGE